MFILTKHKANNLDGNYNRMLRAVLNKFWRQHPTKKQLYSHLPPITKTIKIKQTRDAGHCLRSKDELISDVRLWTPSHGRAEAGRPARTDIQQLCADAGCSPKDLLEATDDREGWRVRGIRAGGVTWWRWWWRWPFYLFSHFLYSLSFISSPLFKKILISFFFFLLIGISNLSLFVDFHIFPLIFITSPWLSPWISYLHLDIHIFTLTFNLQQFFKKSHILPFSFNRNFKSHFSLTFYLPLFYHSLFYLPLFLDFLSSPHFSFYCLFLVTFSFPPRFLSINFSLFLFPKICLTSSSFFFLFLPLSSFIFSFFNTFSFSLFFPINFSFFFLISLYFINFLSLFFKTLSTLFLFLLIFVFNHFSTLSFSLIFISRYIHLFLFYFSLNSLFFPFWFQLTFFTLKKSFYLLFFLSFIFIIFVYFFIV